VQPDVFFCAPWQECDDLLEAFCVCWIYVLSCFWINLGKVIVVPLMSAVSINIVHLKEHLFLFFLLFDIFVHRLFIISSSFVHLLITFASFVRYLFIIYSLFVLYLFIICSIFCTLIKFL